MNTNINAELIKLQEELSTLDSAIKHIAKAEKISSEVVQAVKAIQAQYGEQLNFIMNQYSEYLKHTSEHTEKNIDQLNAANSRVIEEITRVLDKYSYQTNAINSLITSYQKSVEQAERQGSELLKKQFIENQEKVKDLTSSHKKQIESVEKILNEYMKLADATSELSQKIEKVDFPQRLDKIYNAINESNEANKQTLAKIQTFEKKQSDFFGENSKQLQRQLKKQNSAIALNTFLVIISILLIFGVGAILYIKFM